MTKLFCCLWFISLIFVTSLVDGSSTDSPKQPDVVERRLAPWQATCEKYNPKAWWKNYAQEYQGTHVGDKPAWLNILPYTHGHYVQFNLDAQDFCCAMTVKMLAQTLYAMAHTGTRIENFKTAVWRPGVARSVINWVPFCVTCSMLSTLKEKRQLLQQLEAVEHYVVKNDRTESEQSE